ncbi:PREDICTED: uncharacterized protein LOC104613146 [Nelumbo nucifera]|uniref:Uncharacterized protein LOC104613146 n=1 Tax=Nelumbo nucifera TaxID=4432 RepID=A0A1U8QCJ4_NELNU|nr:PREDICTED: uncharacterized protein LOC104613146 [Nelumbo nucifera]
MALKSSQAYNGFIAGPQTDTLLVGQELQLGGPTKIVSRVSCVGGSQGPYRFVMEQKRVALYLKNKNSSNPLLYNYDEFGNGQQSLAYVNFNTKVVHPVLPLCKAKANVNYYKIVVVEHFLNEYIEGDGPMNQAKFRDKCNKECGCLGFFYKEESSKCLLAPELGTLSKVSNSSHVAFIKISK